MSASQSDQRRRLPIAQKTAYALGAVADMIGFHTPAGLIMPIYTLVLGVNPALVAVAIAITRIWDALLDPLMGHVSDQATFRMGRRRPYILIGAISAGIIFTLMWQMPGDWSEAAYFWYLTITLIFFYTAFTVFSVPYHGMGYELTNDYHDRTQVMTFRMFGNMLGNIIVHWLLAATQISYFSDALQGTAVVGPVIGVVFILFGIAPALLLRETPGAGKPQAKQKSPQLLRSMLNVLGNRNFRVLIALTILMLTAGVITGSFILYLNVAYVFGGDLKAASVLAGVIGLVNTFAGVLGVLAAGFLSRRYGKRNMLYLSFVLQTLAAISSWFLITPEWAYLQLTCHAVKQFAAMMFFVMLHSMVSDICDEDDMLHGQRREGLFGAAITWTQKVCVSLGIAASGILLVVIGFNEEPGATQSEQTVLWMRLSYTCILTVKGILGLYLIGRYSLTEARLRDIRGELDKRRAHVEEPDTDSV